jgi:putative CocE/NonD family hydrolase
MFGVSHLAFNQTTTAPLRSPYLKAIMPLAAQRDNMGLIYADSILQLQVAMLFFRLAGRTMHLGSLALIDEERLLRRLPLITALDDLVGGDGLPHYREFIRRHAYDDYWASYSMRDRYDEVAVPAYLVTGWYDQLLNETFRHFDGWRTKPMSQEAREKTKLLVGPWQHKEIGSSRPFGDIDFGPRAEVNLLDLYVRWYDARLKGIDTGVDDDEPIRIFVMGDNVWRQEEEWPLARTKFAECYLHSGGNANTMRGDGTLSWRLPFADEPADHYLYDPKDPVPTRGGPTVHGKSGPWDRRPIEHRNDVLVYTSDPLESDLEVTGPLSAKVYAASSAPDTDFGATLVDVHPDGKAIIIAEGMLRARFRESWDPPVNPKLMKPGEVYAFPIDLWQTSNVFKAGHRVRLEVSSSNFPRFDRNLNTGHQPGMDAEMQVAKQAVYHDVERPSHILLPVIPR